MNKTIHCQVNKFTKMDLISQEKKVVFTVTSSGWRRSLLQSWSRNFMKTGAGTDSFGSATLKKKVVLFKELDIATDLSSNHPFCAIGI